jgi:hypothetical protein
MIVRALLLLVLAASAIAAAEDRGRGADAGERLWQILSLPYVRSIPQVRAMRRVLLGAFFPRWPYRDGHDGYVVLRPLFHQDPRLRLYGGHVGAELGSDRHPEAALDAGIDSTFRLGATLRLQRSWRDDGDGTAGVASSTWRLFETRGSRLRAALGLRWYSGAGFSGVGPDAGLTAEWFPRRPWAIALDGDLGSVGSHLVVGGSLAVGRFWSAVEARGGLRLQSGWPAFHGPFLGLRYWF